MSKIKLTPEEKRAAELLHKLHLVWPKDCWLSISVAGVHIMRYREDGEIEYVATSDIPNDYNRGVR